MSHVRAWMEIVSGLEFGALCVVGFRPCILLFCLMFIFFLTFVYSNMHLDFITWKNLIFLFIVFLGTGLLPLSRYYASRCEAP